MKTSQKRNGIICLVGTMIALFGVAATASRDALDQLMQHTDTMPPVIAEPLGLLEIALLLVSLCAYPVGTGILGHCLSVVLGRPPLSLPVGLSVPISGNVFMALQALPFLSFPAGSRIRPMAWSVMMFYLGVTLLVLGIIAAIRTIKEDHRIVAGLFGVLLSLTPLVVGVLSLYLVCSIKGLEMAE